ncbi:MAG: T9SS type A sorting domain-containing protein [Bacteroidetes bacterium]|nr:T9SS type A sorting domain-containing protein [Bacteroidota bacterium]
MQSFQTHPREITLPEQWIGIGSIDVFNATGQLIKQVNNPSKTLQLNALSAGLYLLKKNNQSIRILIQ